MDMTFNCPHCNQMLEVDSSATGSQIECPACNQAFAVPALPAAESVPAAAAPTDTKPHKQFSVPVRETPAESLIQKPHIPLEAAAKSSGDKTVRIKCIRRTECMEVGHDRFDDIVSAFLGKIGEANIVSINTLAYSHVDIGSQKILTDYGVMIVYKG